MKLDELRGLLEKATPGPLRVAERFTERRWVVEHKFDFPENQFNLGWLFCSFETEKEKEDASLIVALRNNAEALIYIAECAKEALEHPTSHWPLEHLQEAIQGLEER